jgi:Fic family protein
LLPDPHLLVNAYITREAVSSSRIEGTQASVTEVFDAAATGETKRDDIREVRNYVAALNHGVRRLNDDDFPISLRLIKEMHKILLTGVRGQDKTPGEFRTSQNWINSPDNRPETATFVPPPVHEMWQALDDWEKYLHDEAPRLPLLVRCALLHYQFETIHPFLDGNGRLGRLFIVLYLTDRGRLPTPLLYLSSYFDQRKGDYYDRLQYVRERGEVTEWLQFFLDGVAMQATDAVERAEQLSDLREYYRSRLQGGGRAHLVVRTGQTECESARRHKYPAQARRCRHRGRIRNRAWRTASVGLPRRAQGPGPRIRILRACPAPDDRLPVTAEICSRRPPELRHFW